MMWAAAPIYDCWGDRIGAIAEIEAGGTVLLGTDDTWRSGLLPIRRSGIYFGESVDARVEPEETHGVEALPFDAGAPRAARGSVRCASSRRSRPSRPGPDGEATIHDFGQNVGGYVRLTVRGEAGRDRACGACRGARAGARVGQSQLPQRPRRGSTTR